MTSPAETGRSRRSVVGALARTLAAHPAVRFLLIGGLSFVIDLGLLTLCYRAVGTPLWAATAIGFWGSFFFNFFLQRRFSFGATGAVGRSMWRYGVLLAANTLATVIAVEIAERSGLGFTLGKTLITVAQTVVNYFAYRYWVFATPPGRPSTTDHAPLT